MESVDPWMDRWNLTPDGEVIKSNWGMLAPVRYLGAPAMLKIALDIDEEKGGQLMAWWDGVGAARVYEIDGPVMLMERLTGERSLGDMARQGQDDEATRILCEVAARIHCPRNKPRLALTDLDTWFAALWKQAPERGGALAHAAVIARRLIDTEEDRVVLHGDLHHNNVLDGGTRGWLAIDPKFLYGERAFDFVNILRNPDIATSLIPGRFARQVEVIVEAAGLDRRRFLEWTVAYTGLSAAWCYNDKVQPDSDLAINTMAVDLLGHA
jgi:streptomycin 6-kinase